MSKLSLHDEWLSLIEISGPFLAVPVLKEAFPQGLEELDGVKRKRLRQAYEEWREALELEDAQFPELHAAWIDEVLSRVLELDDDGKGDVLKRADWCTANLEVSLPEQGLTLSPDLAVIDEQSSNKPLLLIQTYSHDIDLDVTLKQDGWAASPSERMVQMCRLLGCRLGLVTNGERWMLVDAPVGAVSTFASWYARIWSQEPITLQAFVHLLGIRRFFVDESEQLPVLLDRSLKFQDEVTDALGEQVRRAVEVLIQSLDKADQDRNRELLHDVKESELYEAALTVMMRLVFLLSAEERGLLLMGDERYEANYALSTLRLQLRKESDEVLERRWDAWSRLLAIFRAVYGGIDHENLRLPALGGSLFNPDRFPFLEGRAKGSNWRTDAATPLPIDNRTVLLLLEAIQQFQGRTLSYRALDVEQIGYVYEGLLERTVKRTDEVTLELDATKSAKSPWIKLAELDSANLDGAARLAELLEERSGSSASRVRNDLAKPVDDALADRLLTACQGDTELRDRVKSYAHLLRTDPWGYPLVYPAGAFIVTAGSDRRETGTHYTPKSMTEQIVAETLTPVAYVGPAEGVPRDHWRLRSPKELLDLKICDPAMGSGAFLVQVCRWLSDRLVESWAQVEVAGKTVSVDGEVLESGAVGETLPGDSEARTVIARRLIAERCLYGVDINPLAVELAKLSIWLVTLAKGRPFGFLDHNLRSGDSLLGLNRLEQLIKFSLQPEKKQTTSLFASHIYAAVKDALALRRELRETLVRDIRDVQYMERLDQEAGKKLEIIKHIADAMIGEVLASGGNQRTLEASMTNLSATVAAYIEGDIKIGRKVIAGTRKSLSIDLPAGKPPRKPFHWFLEFPEVFERGGFDGIVGNPPFMGNKKISGILGTSYRTAILVDLLAKGVSGLGDLCAYFFLRSYSLLTQNGSLGLIATDTISQGDTRIVGIERILLDGGEIYRANSSIVWPGKASVVISMVWIMRGHWSGSSILNNEFVTGINSLLAQIDEVSGEPKKLISESNKAFIGSYVLGGGFVLSEGEASELLDSLPKSSDVIYPYVGGRTLNNSPDLSTNEYVVCFFDWPLNDSTAPKGYKGPLASDYPEIIDLIEKDVRPERELKKRKAYRERWWQFAELQKAAMDMIKGQDQVLLKARVSPIHAFALVKNGQIYNEKTVVFDGGFFEFSVYQSSIHESWAINYSSTMGKSTLSYSPSACVDTFPMPLRNQELFDLGGEYHNCRSKIMLTRKSGLTKVFNAFNAENESSSDIQNLRCLHIKMDQAVAAAYGWEDLELAHGFHETKQGVRFTISQEARREILQRLLKLNHERYELETAGLNQKVKAVKKRKVQTPNKQGGEPENSIQPGFDFGGHEE